MQEKDPFKGDMIIKEASSWCDHKMKCGDCHP